MVLAMTSQDKPILIYDGDCNFCQHWVGRWRHVTEDRVDYTPSSLVSERYPDISNENFSQSVQLVEPDGSVSHGAEAILRALACVPGRQWPLALYRHLPGFAFIAEKVYQFVANRR